MRDFSPEHRFWHRDLDAPTKVAVRDDAHGPYPTPAEVCFQIGQTLAVALGIAIAANLVAVAGGV